MARQTPAPGHVSGAKDVSELALASAGSEAGVTTQEPAVRFQSNPFTVPVTSDWPTATQEPAVGQGTSRLSMLGPVGVPAAVGATDEVQGPEARLTKSPCSTPDTRISPVATPVFGSVHATEVSCTSVEGAPPGVGTAAAVHVPADSVSSRPS